MGKVSGLFVVGALSIGLITSSVYEGQEKLDNVEQKAISYSEKTTEVVALAKSLQVENGKLNETIKSLQEELDRNWNTVEEVNALIEETKVLRHRIGVLEEQNTQLEQELANKDFKQELDKANQEIEKANQSTQEHLDTMSSTLDESVFDGVLGEQQ